MMTHWPVLKRYDVQHLDRLALPLGGIGTGTISLGGRGDLRDCEIMNTPAKGNLGAAPFFCLRVAGDGDAAPVLKLLQGPYPDAQVEGWSGATASQHGFPRFRHAEFDAAYPFGQVHLSDPDVPVAVTLQAFNPLIPGDADASGFPVAVLRYVVRNLTDHALDVSVCGTVSNCTGADTPEQAWQNDQRTADGLVGLVCSSTNPEVRHTPTEGEVVLATPQESGHITCRTDWLKHSWGFSLLDFWDDFEADGDLDPRQGPTKWPKASLCVRRTLPAGGETAVTFLLAWRFPNRRTWTPLPQARRQAIDPDHDPDIIGNFYCQRFPSAWAAAAELHARLTELEQRTIAFVHAFLQSPVPETVKEAALFNLSTLRSQTVFRTPDGNLFGWEGCQDRAGSCHGSCTHVWNYEHSTPFLFGELARSMRKVEFLHATDDEGLMSFRVNLPLDRARDAHIAAADGQLGCIMKAYREWLLSGDDGFLRELWPKIRLAVQFIWVKGGWDADQDGIMEGCQHNTMDVEYFGPNAQMQGWYIGALLCAERMATAMDDHDFAQRCRSLAHKAADAMDTQLFNGDYYEQLIQPVNSADDIHPGLRLHMGATNLQKPDVQLGKACLVDQLVGLAMARILGLPLPLSQAHVTQTLQSVYTHNRRIGFWNHFNPMRSYVGADDTALLMASYPHGERPQFPFPYFPEVMTGFEYTAAIGMLYEGLPELGLQVIADIRNRYDGKRRSPFDEAECGHHYARAMAAWGAYIALSGFHYDGRNGGRMAFDGIAHGSWFWSTGDAFGTCTLDPTGRITLTVLEGAVRLRQLHVNGRTIDVGETLRARTSLFFDADR